MSTPVQLARARSLHTEERPSVMRTHFQKRGDEGGTSAVDRANSSSASERIHARAISAIVSERAARASHGWVGGMVGG